MIGSFLRLTAIAISLLVIAGWGLFAIDEARTASNATTAEIADRNEVVAAAPSAVQERERERMNSDLRELVDDANDVLLAPFAGLTEDAELRWVVRTVPAVLALLVYGLGLGFLARFATAR